MIRRIALLLAMYFGSQAVAQFWAPLRSGFPEALGGCRVVFGDTTWDRLHVGSNYKWLIEGQDTLVIVGIAEWDGTRWDTLPDRVQSDQGSTQNGCQPVNNIFLFRNQLYATGSFSFLTEDGLWNDAVARWDVDEQRWEQLECLNPTIGGMLSMFHVPPNDTMYFTGYTGSVCGYPESCVFAYDGNAFYPFAPFGDWEGIPDSDYVGYVFRFQGTLYMTGLLNNTVTGDFHGFLRYTGSGWEPVPGFTTPAPIKNVLIHDDKLYICGYFFTNTGGPGNMVTMFDGETWSDMGGGIRYALPNSTSGIAYDLHELNGDIYVCGQFYYAGGVPAENVARWNGHQWCGMGGTYANEMPDGVVLGVGSWRDTLYIAGGFTTIDGDTLNNIAKWLGVVENCSPSVGVEEPDSSPRVLSVQLLEQEGLWSVALPEGTQRLRVHDATGRVVLEETFRNETMLHIDLRAKGSGIYIISAIDREGVVHSAKLNKP